MTARDDHTFGVAVTVASWIEAEGARAAVIGAVALAAHGFVRATRDLDLATELDPFTQLRALKQRAEARGWSATLALPDAEDPLGGVLTLHGDDFDPVQVVNFHNPLRELPNPAGEALRRATHLEGVPGLRVVSVEDLILLKLYAGGRKSLADIEALLEHHPHLDLEELRRRAASFGLNADLERILRAPAGR